MPINSFTVSKDIDKCVIIIEVSETQKKFLDFCVELKYGIIKDVVVQNGQPVFATTVEKNIKFG